MLNARRGFRCSPMRLSHDGGKAACSLSGFTLLEILATVVILGVLVALLMPAVSRATGQAQSAQCLSNMRTFGAGLLMYAADNDGFPNRIGSADPVHFNSSNGGLINALYPAYIDRPGARRLRCPLANAREREGSGLPYQYAANVSFSFYYPKLTGLPLPSSRVVLAMECAAETYTAGASAANRAMWGNPDGPPADPAERAALEKNTLLRLQYHGAQSGRGLHCFFLDGHTGLVVPENGNWKSGPTYGAKEGGKDNGGYFYDYLQFIKMANGALGIP